MMNHRTPEFPSYYKGGKKTKPEYFLQRGFLPWQRNWKFYIRQVSHEVVNRPKKKDQQRYRETFTCVSGFIRENFPREQAFLIHRVKIKGKK